MRIALLLAALMLTGCVDDGMRREVERLSLKATAIGD